MAGKDIVLVLAGNKVGFRCLGCRVGPLHTASCEGAFEPAQLE